MGVHTTIGALGSYCEFLKFVGALAVVRNLIQSGVKVLGSC